MINSEDYKVFVDFVTSDESKFTNDFVQHILNLQEQGVEISRLITASIGLSSEAGEFAEIVKKILFQGKPYNEENIQHMKIELGDALWYIMQACLAFNISLEELIQMNTEKLSSRYPGGFSAFLSENRRNGDL